MPCFHPKQAFFKINKDGKKEIQFCDYLQSCFERGVKPVSVVTDRFDGKFALPCGNCIGCRLERSRQWAVRCTHEASLYEDNCFLTLTYSPEFLPSDGSLKKFHLQQFIRDLRDKFCYRKGSPLRIRYFGCGEYGDKLGRPHYHLCLFNFDFKDKLYWKSVGGCKYYTSSDLEILWPYGYSAIGDLTFESAAYVARYCTKKITGKIADDYYQGKACEFPLMSLKPGIGFEWFQKFKGDVFPSDEVIVRGFKCKPPRYYDKLLNDEDEEVFEEIKERRRQRALEKEDDNTHRRLLVKEKCQSARMKQLIRKLETDYDR